MPVLSGNDVVTINGGRLAQQGIGYLATGVTPAQAGEKTKANGMDEIILAVENESGQSELVMVYADKLDFSFRDQNSVPQITVNGKRATMLHFEDEANTGMERALRGAKQGFSDAFDTMGSIAKKTMERAPIMAGATFLAGTGWIIVGREAAVATLRAAAGALARPVAMTGLAVIGVGSLVILAAGLVKGLMGGGQPKMETLAGVISDKPVRPAPAPAAPVAPAAPAPTTPAAPVVIPSVDRPASNLARRPLRVTA